VHPKPYRIGGQIKLALASGTLAILANTALLMAADQAGIATAHGGLLTLLRAWTHIPDAALATSWPFQLAFHFCVGIAMAIFYGLIAGDPRRHSITKSFSYALAVWLANACVVLPLIGQGFAGSHALSFSGIVLFALAHTTFFMVNGLLLSGFSKNQRARLLPA
jgi:hypothetical protein